MADQEREGHPILSGIAALVGVTVVVGGILGGGAVAATHALGLGSHSEATGKTTSSETLYLPPLTNPADSDSDQGSIITISPDPAAPTTPASPSSPASRATPDTKIRLLAQETAVAPMGHIDLTITYPSGVGAILQVQQFQDGAWGDFPVTVSMDAATKSTYIQAGALGPNRFRVVDTDTDEASNVVRVRIG